MIEALILSIVQGITEFLPISSSSHLLLASEYLNLSIKSLSQDISLHIGSFIAVLIYFKEEMKKFIENKILFLKIIIASLPVILSGIFLTIFELSEIFRNIYIIAWTTVAFAILLFIADKFEEEKCLNNLSYKSSLIIGFFQILSLIPGVSRSGITITAARFLSFNRVDSAKISFLLSIPTLGAVTFYGFYKIVNSNDATIFNINIASIVMSCFFSYITIRFFLKYIQNFNLNIFIIYRIAIGLILFYLLYS
jgi:undecaprenyl-diphosphatase|tara:strand:- start:4699 stop:5454 length:756 start_codon:yes stop_codon:yes gene_type:complete